MDGSFVSYSLLFSPTHTDLNEGGNFLSNFLYLLKNVFMSFLTLYIVTAFEPYYIRIEENNYSCKLCLIQRSRYVNVDGNNS